MPVRLPNAATTRLLDLIEAIRQIAEGRGNAGGVVTLTANQATTTVTATVIGRDAHIGLMPTTANAAAEIGAGTMYVSAQATGSFTLTHANNAQADRSFRWSATNG